MSEPDLPSEREDRERARRAEERFRLLVESVHGYAIFMLDPAGHVTSWNSGAERINGYTSAEILGRHFSVFYPPEDAAAGECDAELATAARDGRFEDEGWRVRKDGSRLWATVLISAMRSSDGELLGFAKVTRDLTERRRAEEERLKRLQAEEALRLRDEFLAVASHELRTPLTSLRLQLEGLRRTRGEFGELGDRRLEQAARSTARLAELVEALLDVTHITSRGVDLARTHCDLAEIAAEVVEALREAAARAGCAVSVAGDGRLPGHWDRARIGQVVTNLLSNAIRYGAGGAVELRLRREEAEAVLEISDHGPGISEPDLPRIFERFERASSWRHFGGLGLGLFVTREIVVAHGGDIQAAPWPGAGTRFTVRLPLDAAP